MTNDIGGAWSATVVVSPAHTDAFEQAFVGLATVVSLYEYGNSDLETDVPWAVEGMFSAAPPRDALTARIALAAEILGIPEPELVIAKVPAKDWLTENVAAFPPLRAGRFYIHGDHVPGPHPPGAKKLKINAATAFGSGQHASTMGCLLALDGLFRGFQRVPTPVSEASRGLSGAQMRAPVRQKPAFRRLKRALDMGCGTGILAMAIAAAGRVPVLAVDIDPEAVRVTRFNVARNGLTPFVKSIVADGSGQRAIAAGAPYDVITANILARPLMRMARDLAALLAPGGHIVLAGFLRRHEAMVLTAYRMQGLKLVKRYRLKPWTTLVLRR